MPSYFENTYNPKEMFGDLKYYLLLISKKDALKQERGDLFHSII